jgi:hypothetical protein
MATPTATVEVGFDLLASGNLTDAFILDDTVQGVLDNTTYTLAGETWTDVTSYVRLVNIRRGRSTELDRYNAGQVSVTFDNRARDFDPTNTGGAFYPNVKPRKPLRVTLGGNLGFFGQVEDWGFDFTVGGDATATVSGSDGFALLAGQEIVSHAATSQAPGTRIGAILDRAEIDWPNALRDIDTGSETLQADTVAVGSNALQYLQNVEATEPGAMFVSRSGMFTFRGRNTSPETFSDVAFTDAGGGIPFTEISVGYGSELIYNVVTVTRAGGTAQRVDNSAGTGYAISALSRDGLLHNTDAAALDLAQWWAQSYSEPLVRIRSVTTELTALDATQQGDLLALDLADVISITFNGVQSWSKIESIEHQITAASHQLTFGLASATTVGAFVLDSDLYGVLDSNRLAF